MCVVILCQHQTFMCYVEHCLAIMIMSVDVILMKNLFQIWYTTNSVNLSQIKPSIKSCTTVAPSIYRETRLLSWLQSTFMEQASIAKQS